MNSVENVRSKIQHLYRTHPEVHMSINLKNSRLHPDNMSVVIKGVYPNVFRVEDNTSGIQKFYTYQYNKIVTKEIVILELEDLDVDTQPMTQM